MPELLKGSLILGESKKSLKEACTFLIMSGGIGEGGNVEDMSEVSVTSACHQVEVGSASAVATGL